MAHNGIDAITWTVGGGFSVGRYHHTGRFAEVKRQIVHMALNGSGIRATARVLGVSPATGHDHPQKKAQALHQVNPALVSGGEGAAPAWCAQGGGTEWDEMWSFVGRKQHPRWL